MRTVVTLNNRRFAEMKATPEQAQQKINVILRRFLNGTLLVVVGLEALAHTSRILADLAATFPVGLLSNAMNNLPVGLIGVAAVRASHVTTIPNDSRALNCSALFVGEMEGSGFIPNSRFDLLQSRVDVFAKPRIF